MPNITLPDGSVRNYDGATNGAEIAASIGKSLARDAVALRVNGELFDIYLTEEASLTDPVATMEEINIITPAMQAWPST